MFEGPKLKIKRANRHIDELNSCLIAFCETDFCTLDIKSNEQGGDTVTLKMTKELPCEVPLMIGDAVHNLHTALDFLFCDLVRMSGETPDEYTKFVFRDTRDNLVGSLKNGKLKAAKSGIIDVIADTVKPYKGGNDALYALHDIDIQDKHLLLVPIVTIYGLRDVRIDDDRGTTSRTRFMQGDSSRGPNLTYIGMYGKVKIASYAQPAFAVVFGDVPFFGRQGVVPSLHKLSQLVFGVIDTLEDKCK